MPFSYVEMMTAMGLGDYAELPLFEPIAPAPLAKPIAESRVGVFTSCGALRPGQRAFEPQNDLTFRLLPREIAVAELTFAHPTPVRGFAVEDLNVAYPRDRLIEMEAAGMIGELAPRAVSMLGSITRYSELLEQTAPVVAETFSEQAVDVVLLVPFCPACHRATALMARGLEARGIPCVYLSVLREMAEAFRPARPVFLDFPLGATVGRPNDPELQRAILHETFAAAERLPADGTIHELPFQWSGDDRSWEDEVRAIYAETGREIHRRRVAAHIADGERLAGREAQLNISCAC
jgi:D-proline reductase (dithiol) PrdB